MALGDYEKTTYVNGQAPGISANNLNKNEDKTEELDTAVKTHLADYVKQVPYAVATGVANSYAVTLDPAPTTYVDGMAVAVKINVTSTGASTLNINGLGAKAIKDSIGNAITSDGLKADLIYSMRYNATTENFIVQGKGGGGNLQPNQALAGYTFTNDNGPQIGLGDANLIAANILSGVDIFGVIGNVVPKYLASGTGTFVTGSNYVTVTGITFTPKTLIAQFDYSAAGYSFACMYSTELSGFAHNNFLFDRYYAGAAITGFSNITSTGFKFTDSSHINWDGVTTNFRWWALG